MPRLFGDRGFATAVPTERACGTIPRIHLILCCLFRNEGQRRQSSREGNQPLFQKGEQVAGRENHQADQEVGIQCGILLTSSVRDDGVDPNKACKEEDTRRV